MKFLIYLRVSTKEQDEETQLMHILRFLKQKVGGEFQYLVFRDKITSKKALFKKSKDSNKVIFKREGFRQLMEAHKKGDTIVSIRIDRIARKAYEIHTLIDILKQKNSEIILVDQPKIDNMILLGVYAGMAEEEVKTLGKRVSEKLECKKVNKERYSRFLPYGYTMHKTHMVPIRKGDSIVYLPGVLVPLAEEQQTVDRMRECFEQGMSYKQICKALTDQGYRNREGKPFQPMSIYRILSRIGYTRSQDQPLEEREFLLSH